MKKLLALLFVFIALTSRSQTVTFDTLSFLQGGYMFKAPQDNIFDWNETKYMPYAAKKTTNPGYPYFYTNSGPLAYPSFSNPLCLDAYLYTNYLSVGSSSNQLANYWPGYMVFQRILGGFVYTHEFNTTSGYMMLVSSATNGVSAKSCPIYIGDNSSYGGRVNEQIIIDPENTRFDINMSKTRLNKGTASKYLYLDANKEISYVDGPSSLWNLNGSKIYYNTGNVGIGDSNPIADLTVNGWASISDSLVTPLVSNVDQLSLKSQEYSSSTTAGGLSLSGYFGKSVLYADFFKDGNISKGKRRISLNLQASSPLASLAFIKNDTITLADYRFDTSSLYTDYGRKDLGKSLLPWRNIYTQYVYSNGLTSNGDIYVTKPYDPTIYIGNGGADQKPRLVFMQDGDEGAVFEQENDNGGRLFITNKVNTGFGNISFKTNDVERLTLLQNGFIGIGETNPLALLHSSSDGSGAWWNDAYSNTSGNKPNFVLRRSAGTKSSPTKILSGFDLGAVTFYGAYGSPSGFASGAQARIIAQAEEDFNSSTTMGTRMFFGTTPTGGSLTTRLMIKGNGFIGIGTTAPELILNSYSSSAKQALFNGYSDVSATAKAGIYNGSIAIGNNSNCQGIIDYYSGSAPAIFTIRNTYAVTTSNSRINFDIGTTNMMTVQGSGNIGIGTSAPSTKLDINSNTFRLRTARTVVNSTDEGNAGDISWDANYIYVCIATNTWKRSAISTW